MWNLRLIFVIFALKTTHSLDCKAFLTISTKDYSYFYTNLVVNWGPECEEPPASIRLYDYNPYDVEAPPLFVVFPQNKTSGRVDTNIKLNGFKLPHTWDSTTKSNEIVNFRDQQKCLDYFLISYDSSSQAKTFDCLKIEPQWMTEMMSIWSIPLKELYIPGTHCSGCYMTRENARDKKDKEFLQNFDVWSQLVFGVRYLDFSIGLHQKVSQLFYDPEGPFFEKIFWVQHNNVLVSPLLKILREVVKFAKRSNEVIIISFSSFSEGFDNSEIHEVLKLLINDEVGNVSLMNQQNGRQSFEVTISEMKNAGKNLLINYNHYNLSTSYENETTIFWPMWSQSAEFDTKPAKFDVVSYMRNVFTGKYRGDDSNGWILSLNVDKFIVGNEMKPRDKAEIVNFNALFALGGPWSLKANVVALDFAFATNFIDIAIYTNQQKGAAKGNLTVIDLS